ncbi:unnamed protein product [Peronospora belbahrii]|uniref:Uncharacterized protein n=1 Tax=Peronospora belbahrii TaxID=622444 RepID=A0AAU9KVE9_9STRA|nr:unnamed protein product [Peronospora belbahrii]
MDEDKVGVEALLEYVKRLEGRLEAMEEELLQEETIKNNGPFGRKMTLIDLSGDNGIERGGARRAQSGNGQQKRVQGMAGGSAPQGNPAGNQMRMGGNIKIPKLTIQIFTGAEIYPERLKVNKLGQHLEEVAADYVQANMASFARIVFRFGPNA